MAAANYCRNSSPIRASLLLLMVVTILLVSSSSLASKHGHRGRHTVEEDELCESTSYKERAKTRRDWSKYGLPNNCGQLRKNRRIYPNIIWGPECRKEGKFINERVYHAGCVDDQADNYFSSFVYIVWRGTTESKLYCSGVLVSPDVVLTAVNCVYGREQKELGVVRSLRFAPGNKIIGIDSIWVGDNSGPKGAKQWSDVAIFVLKEKVKISNTSVACLPDENYWADERVSKYLVGMGDIVSLFNDNPDNSITLTPERASLSQVTKVPCKVQLPDNEVATIEETTATCFVVKKHPDATFWGTPCDGDTGAPIYAIDKKTQRISVIGIVSSGWRNCSTITSEDSQKRSHVAYMTDLFKIATDDMLLLLLRKADNRSPWPWGR